MKDKDNVLRLLDDVDNMILVFDNAVKNGNNIDKGEARSRFNTIRKKLQVIISRVTVS
jgi:phosphomevalonate kinase